MQLSSEGAELLRGLVRAGAAARATTEAHCGQNSA